MSYDNISSKKRIWSGRLGIKDKVISLLGPWRIGLWVPSYYTMNVIISRSPVHSYIASASNTGTAPFFICWRSSVSHVVTIDIC